MIVMNPWGDPGWRWTGGIPDDMVPEPRELTDWEEDVWAEAAAADMVWGNDR